MDIYMNDVFQLTLQSMDCGTDEIALQVYKTSNIYGGFSAKCS